MLNIVKYYSITACLILSMVLTSCEDDGELTEQDILELSSASVLLVTVQEGSSSSSPKIPDATVTLTTRDGAREAITDMEGIATFENLLEGTYFLRIEKDGFESVSGEVSVFTSGRNNTSAATFTMFSFDNVATIRGDVIIQTDLTTPEYEVVNGITISAVDDQTDVVIAQAQTSEGSFELQIPTNAIGGRDVRIVVPTLSFDQQIAIREGAEVNVRTARGTVFDPDEEAESLPSTANILADVVAPAFGGGRRGYIESLTVATGVITGLVVSDTGFGYSGSSTVTINSPDGGSGAAITVSGSFDSSVSCRPFPEDFLLNGSFSIFNGGTGYPDYIPNQNVTTRHPEGFTFDGLGCDKLEDGIFITAGEVYNLTLNYGTGTTIGNIE